MAQQSQVVNHIESYVDSSISPSQQAASVNAIASLLKNDIITMEYVVREMELYLTTTDHILRARGMLLLAEVLVHLQLKPLGSTTIHTLIGFFTERLTDWRALRGALLGCLALVRRKSNVGVVAGSDAKALAQSYLENLQVQSLGQEDRKLCFELLECLLDRFPEDIAALGDHLVYGICEAIEGEKDPQCLIHAFHIVEVLATIFCDPAGPVASFAEDLFDIIGRYFPIHYTHPKSEDVNVSRDDLSRALMLALSASPFFEPFSVPLLLEKLSSALPLAQLDSLKYLSYCTVKYGPERIAKHAEAIWSSLRATIYNFPEEHSLSLTSYVANSMGFQYNELTKEALGLLQMIVSQQNIGFLNLVLNDEKITSLVNSVAVSGSSNDIPMKNEQELFALGCVLSVLAKASTASCNRVFEAVFIHLVNTLGVLPNRSLEDATAIHANVHYQRLNFCALYLCIQILTAYWELAVCSVQHASNCNFVEDTWCQMLSTFCSSLMKAFVSNLIPSSNSTDDMYEDADLSLRVKGLQVLATFPGGCFPVSKSIFENIIDALVSIVIENFNLMALWKMSLNVLVKIGEFLEEHPDPEKSLSYVSSVVERFISLISMDDYTMPYPLILEAISDIGASGGTSMLRIIQGVQEAMSAKFSKVYVDGDLRVAAQLVHLLECYSNKLLPWFQKVEGSKGVPMRFAINIWDQIEAAITFSYVQGKDLQNVTMAALKQAVAICSEEDQFTIVEKAFRVISSNESFSPNFVRSQLEGLRIAQDTDSFTCTDEWLISLFASVVIALRPKTQIPHIRAVVQSLLMAYLKGNETSAQALGSIVNKMPLKDIGFQNSSYFSLDDALELIFRMSLGSCNIHSEMGYHSEEHLNLADSPLCQNCCISGLAWIGKGLLMRGHERVKDITMIFLKCLVSSSEQEISSEKQKWSERTEEVNVGPSMLKYVADAFHVVMSDSEECLNRTLHATVRPLYKQRFFSTLMPILLSEAKKSRSPEARSMLYRAIGHVISDTPLAAVLTESKKLLPVLLDVISVLSEDILNKDMVYNLLLVLSGVLMDKSGQDTAVENTHVIINCLTRLLLYPHKMLVRETAIQCLAAMSGMPHMRIYPMRTQVLGALSKVVDDPKRAVRQEAVRCRQAWASVA